MSGFNENLFPGKILSIICDENPSSLSWVLRWGQSLSTILRTRLKVMEHTVQDPVSAKTGNQRPPIHLNGFHGIHIDYWTTIWDMRSFSDFYTERKKVVPYPSALRKIKNPEYRRFNLHRSGSLKSRTIRFVTWRPSHSSVHKLFSFHNYTAYKN